VVDDLVEAEALDRERFHQRFQSENAEHGHVQTGRHLRSRESESGGRKAVV